MPRFSVHHTALFALFFGPSATAQTAQSPHTLTGDIRVHRAFHSKILNNERDVVVYVPPGYETNKKKRYPVLYLHDGQNLFDGSTSFIPGQEWRVDETAQSSIITGEIKPIIIVGIYNSGKDRIHEYTPVQDSKHKLGGKADLYGRMIVEEVKPFMDLNYRTLKSARVTALGGSSLGGLGSLYLGLRYPNVFGRLAIMSPSVWFGDKFILRYVKGLAKRPHSRIWLDIGTREGRDAAESQETVANVRLLRDALVEKGWKLGRDLSYFEADGADHSERAWAERLQLILRFLFPTR